MAKKTSPKKAKPQGRAKPAPAPTPATASATTRSAAPVRKPAGARTARHRRAFLTPAAARGLDAVKYIRIHERKAYGRRGEQAIIDIVKQAGHLARVELGESATVEEPKSK